MHTQFVAKYLNARVFFSLATPAWSTMDELTAARSWSARTAIRHACATAKPYGRHSWATRSADVTATIARSTGKWDAKSTERARWTDDESAALTTTGEIQMSQVGITDQCLTSNFFANSFRVHPGK